MDIFTLHSSHVNIVFCLKKILDTSEILSNLVGNYQVNVYLSSFHWSFVTSSVG